MTRYSQRSKLNLVDPHFEIVVSLVIKHSVYHNLKIGRKDQVFTAVLNDDFETILELTALASAEYAKLHAPLAAHLFSRQTCPTVPGLHGLVGAR